MIDLEGILIADLVVVEEEARLVHRLSRVLLHHERAGDLCSRKR